MALNEIPYGNRAEGTTVFRLSNGTLTDPATVTFKFRDTTGAETAYVYPHATIVRISAGIYQFTTPNALTVVGDYFIRVTCANGVGAQERKFTLLPSVFTSP